MKGKRQPTPTDRVYNVIGEKGKYHHRIVEGVDVVAGSPEEAAQLGKKEFLRLGIKGLKLRSIHPTDKPLPVEPFPLNHMEVNLVVIRTDIFKSTPTKERFSITLQVENTNKHLPPVEFTTGTIHSKEEIMQRFDLTEADFERLVKRQTPLTDEQLQAYEAYS